MRHEDGEGWSTTTGVPGALVEGNEPDVVAGTRTASDESGMR